MNRAFSLIVAIAIGLTFSHCGGRPSDGAGKAEVRTQTYRSSAAAHTDNQPFTEDFEKGTKAGYADGVVTLGTGSWQFTDALCAQSENDHGNGAKCVRLKGNGSITMLFDLPGGAKDVTIATALYGHDAACTWALWMSTDGGQTWAQTGEEQTTSSATPGTANFTPGVTAPVRFQLRKLSGTGRLNVDDFKITGSNEGGSIPNSQADDQPSAGNDAARGNNMAMGNPSNATPNISNRNNYLIEQAEYTLSYNNSKGMANWVSWHLSNAWMGSAKRCNCFEPNTTLPGGLFQANTGMYTGTGFDRGHLCPSDDRTASAAENAHTFLMTNMSPQAPNMNEVTWEALESYCRKLAREGNELYIIAGGYGSGGTGRNGTATSIAGGAINVPARFWKIVVVLPGGTNDVQRISTATRVIAVDMPNTQSVKEFNWTHYRTSVDAIETATGYDFLTNVPVSIQKVIEAQTDDGPSQ